MTTICTILTVIAISVVSGTLGGLTHYLLFNEKEDKVAKNIIKSIIIGICAALVVPLFLETISSHLLQDCQTDPTKFLIYAGFCIIVAIFSRGFFNKMSEAFLKNEVDKAVQKKTEPIKAFIEQNTESDKDLEKTFSLDAFNLKGLGDDVQSQIRKVLGEFKNTKFTYRTINVLVKKTGIDKQVVEMIMNQLEKKGIVIHFEMEDKNPDLWCLTAYGKELEII